MLYGGSSNISIGQSRDYKLIWSKNRTGSFKAELVVHYDNFTKSESATRNFILLDPPESQPGGGGGGGGGGVLSGYPYCKTSIRESREGYLHANISTNYTFITPFLGMNEILITPAKNLGVVDIKVVKCISEITGTSQHPGIAYIFNDIQASARELSLDNNIIAITYRFRVEKSWLSENNIAESNMMLSRWDEEKWLSLQTHVSSRDEKFIYYEATTNEIGLFAITTIPIQLSPPVFQLIPTEETTLVPAETPIPAVSEPKISPFIDLLSALAVLGITSYLILHLERKPQ